MSTFVESQHPRTRTPGVLGNGQFAAKSRSESAVSLVDPTPARIDAFEDQPEIPVGELLDALHTQARALMDQHGLHDWVLAYDSGRGNTMGQTVYGRKLITLSAANLSAVSGAQRRDTVLHEIAHALCDINEGHGWRWQEKARELGANPSPAAHGLGSTVHVSAVIGACPMGHERGAGRMPSKDMRARQYCGHKDHPRSQPVDERRITWRRNVMDPQIEAAIKRYPEPAPTFTPVRGDRVTLNVPGYKYDGYTGEIIESGRKYCVVQLDEPARVRVKAPFEAVNPA